MFCISEPFIENMFFFKPQTACGNLKLEITLSLYKNEQSSMLGSSSMDQT
jgi:hypothetical protein